MHSPINKWFPYLILLLTITQIFTSSTIQAQEEIGKKRKMIWQLHAGAFAPILKTNNHLNPGLGIAGSGHFSISNSVKLGAELSFQHYGQKGSFEDFNVMGLNLDVMWFPAGLSRSISGRKDSTAFDHFYFGLKLGHDFSPLSKDNIALSSASRCIGYLIPLRNQDAINIKLIQLSHVLEAQPAIEGHNIFAFIGASVGYAFR